MTTLITLLISLLGYGTPADYSDYTEDQLNAEIAEAEANTTDDNAATDDGGSDTWDEAGYTGGQNPTNP